MGAERRYMKYNPDVHHRKSIRLKEYDYSQEGMYYITICTQDRECILGEIVGANSISAQMKLNDAGNIINNIYLDLVNQIKNIKLHDYIIMPNHLHGIIEICGAESISAQSKEGVRADMESAPTMSPNIHSLPCVHIVIKYIPSFE